MQVLDDPPAALMLWADCSCTCGLLQISGGSGPLNQSQMSGMGYRAPLASFRTGPRDDKSVGDRAPCIQQASKLDLPSLTRH